MLTYDNGQGLLFRRTISIDDSYMFTVKDEVENKSGRETALVPYGRIYRFGTPKIEGWAILHEGLIGWIGEERLQEITYADLTKEAEKSRQGQASQRGAKVFKPATGGWLGFTDKYWSAALVPAAGQAVRCPVRDASARPPAHNEIFWANYQLAPVDRRRRPDRRHRKPDCSPAPSSRKLIDGYGKRARHRALRPDGRLGHGSTSSPSRSSS